MITKLLHWTQNEGASSDTTRQVITYHLTREVSQNLIFFLRSKTVNDIVL